MARRDRINAQNETGFATAAEDDEPAQREGAEGAPDAASVDFKDPATQFKVLNPDVLGYELELPGADEDAEPTRKQIEIALSFTPNQIYKQRIVDEIDAFVKVVRAELEGLAGESASLDPDWLARYPGYFEAALARPAVRQTLREMVSKMARVPGPVDEKGNRAYYRVTLEEVATGMSGDDLTSLGILVIAKHRAEVVKRLTKKLLRERAAAGEDTGTATSTPRSSTTTPA